VEEVSIPALAIEMLAKATKKAGFFLADHRLEIECFCNDCTVTEAQS
jgi:Fe2+ or Zn2+ uptake regulation protein